MIIFIYWLIDVVSILIFVPNLSLIHISDWIDAISLKSKLVIKSGLVICGIHSAVYSI